MDFTIRKLIPELANDYVRFFDSTPHDQHGDNENIGNYSCYCVCWCNDDYEGKDFSTPEKRRQAAIHYVKNNNIQGYLAYSGDTVVGWCNTNTKSDCLKCASWRRFMGYVPLDEPDIRVKSIFCFVIAPEMKRKGIATQLMNRICEDATQDGFDFVEGYPYKESSSQSSNFGGYFEMYNKYGFYVSADAEESLIMRKKLK